MRDQEPDNSFRIEISGDEIIRTETSKLTGRSVWFNSHEKIFLLSKDVKISDLSNAARMAFDAWENIADHKNKGNGKFLKEVESLIKAQDVDEFVVIMNRILANINFHPWRARRPRVGDLLLALWGTGYFAFPLLYPYHRLPADGPISSSVWNKLQKMVEQLREILDGMRGTSWRHLYPMLLRIGGLREVGDIPPKLIKIQLSLDPAIEPRRRMAADRLRVIHLKYYPAYADRIVASEYLEKRQDYPPG
jgi:hypothetical protein